MQRLFLRSTLVLGCILLVVGIWEWRVAGAVHQIVLGIVILALTVVATRATRGNGS
jgi:hypothetical protein